MSRFPTAAEFLWHLVPLLAVFAALVLEGASCNGEQKSPGIIPLAVKDVFGIIQETPGREFLLRVSYLEIYNEVINDLLDPTGQNLRIREDVSLLSTFRHI
ncbi:hypothetical protein CsSME_00014872 [Camellia sinensis var. sinensis]